MSKLTMQIKGWHLISTTWPYSVYGRWPYYRSGMILDSNRADVARMQLKPWGFIQLAEGMKN